MIKKFKIFNEKLITESAESYLADLLDNEIEEWYENTYDIGIMEILDMFPSIVWDHMDDERFVDDYTREEKENREIDEFDSYEFKPYIEKKLDGEKEKLIKNIYRKNKNIDDDIKADINGTISINNDTIIIKNKNKNKKYKLPNEHDIIVNNGQEVKKGEKITKLFFNDYMLEELSDDEMKSIIIDTDGEEDFIDDLIDDRYDSYTTVKDIIEEIYGGVDHMSGDEIYKWVGDYIYEDEVIKNYKENEDFDYKREIFINDIPYSIDLQNIILYEYKEGVLYLAELLKDVSVDNTISDQYDFQKAFIDEYVKEFYEEGEDKGELIADALEKLYIEYNFEKHEDIENEYSEYMWKVDSNKYNL